MNINYVLFIQAYMDFTDFFRIVTFMDEVVLNVIFFKWLLMVAMIASQNETI